jgi:hypothetical protein
VTGCVAGVACNYPPSTWPVPSGFYPGNYGSSLSGDFPAGPLPLRRQHASRLGRCQCQLGPGPQQGVDLGLDGEGEEHRPLPHDRVRFRLGLGQRGRARGEDRGDLDLLPGAHRQVRGVGAPRPPSRRAMSRARSPPRAACRCWSKSSRPTIPTTCRA